MRRAAVKRTTFTKRVPKRSYGRSAIVQQSRPPVMPVYGELKFHDIDVDLAAGDRSAGAILNAGSINLIAQGVTESQRIGRKCTIKNINWRGQLQLVASATIGTPQTCRLMLILDKQCNGAAATVGGVLESTNYQSFNNLANKGRFQTLSDQAYTLNPKAAGGNGTANDVAAVLMDFAIYKKCDLSIEFDSTAGAITEIRSNNLFILLITSDTGSLISLDSKIRLRFEG